MKPVINLDDLELVSHEDGAFVGRFGVIGERIGARRLGYNLTICPPGKKVCPFHNHRVEEEMFLILEGEGLLRFGDQEYPLRQHDVIACPPGGRDVAHQIVNTGKTDLKYLALSTLDHTEVCEYPDSNKVSVYVGKQGARDLRLIFRAEQTVDYFDRETK
jgi:uncharacterized cupin superfamily protein